MKRVLCTIFIVRFVLVCNAQELKVTEFYMDQSDLTANQQGTIVTDQNGEKCALIKIITTGTDFRFDVGSLGIRKIEQKTGEIWLYVPFGIKRIKLNHQKYGYCEFPINIAIEKARTYVMRLFTKAIVEGGTENFGQITVNSDPEGAEVYLDGINVGFTPYYFEYAIPGKHKVSIRKVGYFDSDSNVDIKMGENVTLNQKIIKSCDIVRKPSRIDIIIKDVTFSMIKVEGGSFMMGATSEQKKSRSDEKPAHDVTLSDYFIGETEVTNALWASIMGSNPSLYFTNLDQPVNNITWEDGQKFINRLNSLTGLEFCFPTEAQWEFAARGGKKSLKYMFPGSNNAKEICWFKSNSKEQLFNVKLKTPNELGLYDMGGNVYEWCNDWYAPYSPNQVINPQGPSSGSTKIYRGGNSACDEKFMRVSCRFAENPSAKSPGLGMRLCMIE